MDPDDGFPPPFPPGFVLPGFGMEFPGFAAPAAPFPQSTAAGAASAATAGGVGYAGDKRSDAANLRNGKKQAAKRCKEEKAKQERIVKTCVSNIESISKEPPSDEVMQTLRAVLREYVPSEWAKSYKLIRGTLTICEAIANFQPQSLGNMDDEDEGLIHAIDEFGRQADVLASTDDAANHLGGDPSSASRSSMTNAQKEQDVIASSKRLRKLAMKASLDHFGSEEIGVMDPHQNYRKALRPLCFALVPKLKYFKFGQKPTDRGRNIQKIFKEISAYSNSLPVEYGSSIFLRVQEDRLDRIRALIIGPEDTPYANGCFVFDIWLNDYPNSSPSVHFLTTGGGKYRFNPNLYNCGKVCLSLLGTWTGPGWVSGSSTLLQVLISIQSLILVPDPYFNEPGYSREQNTPRGKAASDRYNRDIKKQTLECAILPFLSASTNPYPEFQDAIDKHFHFKRHAITKQLALWHEENSSLFGMYISALNHLTPAGKKRNAEQIATKTKVHDNGHIEILDEDVGIAVPSRATRKRRKLRNAESTTATVATSATQPSAAPVEIFDIDGDEGGGSDGGGGDGSGSGGGGNDDDDVIDLT
mmetsp:Transcript_21823/g.62162  ORF Transcript_21823/g.62162 Transcript_21823/m.62162 type:complete len:586 (-) Transcript_21823:144-1901(-)